MCRSSIYNYAYSVRNKDKGYYLVTRLNKNLQYLEQMSKLSITPLHR